MYIHMWNNFQDLYYNMVCTLWFGPKKDLWNINLLYSTHDVWVNYKVWQVRNTEVIESPVVDGECKLYTVANLSRQPIVCTAIMY
jgi:hypothetical protein